MMEIRHLRYFEAVADELNITRAAERLHMAQPPLSRQIRQLEDELGVALLERGGRTLKLTEAGRFFLEQSRQLTTRLTEVVEGTRRLGGVGRRWFGVGLVPSTLYGFIPDLLRLLREEQGEVEVGLVELTTLQQGDALRAGRIDIAFGRIVVDDPTLVRRVLVNEPLVAAVPAASPLARCGRLSIAQIAAEPLVLYPARPRPSYADHVLALFRGAGHAVRVVHEANELQTALGLIAAGIGATLVPESVQRLHRDDVAYVKLDAPGFGSPVIMSHRRGDASPFLARTVEAALALAAQQ